MLFPLVVIIWGLVIYRVLGAFGDEKVILPVGPRVIVEEAVKMERDTFSLLPVERDPFLGHYYKKPVQPKTRRVVPVQKPEWPEISYLGLISDTGKSSAIHILQVNGKQVIMEKNENAEEIKLIGSTTGQVTLLYKGDRKIIKKEN